MGFEIPNEFTRVVTKRAESDGKFKVIKIRDNGYSSDWMLVVENIQWNCRPLNMKFKVLFF